MTTEMKKWRVSAAGLLLAAAMLLAWPTSAIELKAGTAKGVITPADPIGRIMVMGRPAKGVEHDLYARVLVLDDGVKKLVIVTYDLNCLDVATPILRSRCRRELGIDPAYLLLLATHNHAAPIQIAPGNFDYGRWLAEKIFSLIQEAISNQRGPVKIFFGAGQGNFLRGDPRYPSLYGWRGRAVDSEIQLLKVTAGDQVAALLFNFPTHPLQASFSRIEVGHPGYSVEELEKQMPGALALYSDACGADQFSRQGLVMWAPRGTVQSLGRKLANRVLDIAQGPLTEVTGPISSRFQVLSLPLAPPLDYEAAKKLAEKIPQDIGLVPYPNPDRESNWIRSLLQHYQDKIPFPTKTTDRICTDDGFLVRELDTPREFPCVYEETIVASIGPLVFAAMQGEVCAPIGKQIKDAFRGRAPVMVSAYMGEHNLYLPTRELVRIHAYQAEVIQTQYASPVGWAPEVEEELVEGVKRMIESALNHY